MSSLVALAGATRDCSACDGGEIVKELGIGPCSACEGMDGREYVFDVNRMWRKNRTPNAGTSCVGVDLNRNYDLLWGIETVATSSNPCSNVYFGPSAFSEAETRNVKRLLDDYAIDCMVDVHSYSELILHPWGHAPNQTVDPSQRFTLVGTSGWAYLPSDAPGYEEYMPPKDLERFEKVGAAAAKAINDVRGRVYVVEQGTDLYETTGTTSDYAYSRHVANPELRKVYGFTFETGYSQGTAEDSFQPPFPEADRIAEEATSGLMSILHSCVCAIHLIGIDLFGDEEEETLTTMRGIRDHRLLQTENGREWVEMLERHQAELIQLATTDEAFRSISGELITMTGKMLRSEGRRFEHGRELRQLLSELEGSGVSPELRADLRRLHLLTRQIEDRPIDDAIDFLEEVRPYSAKGG